MSQVKKLPPRSEVLPADTWDLSPLFPSDEAWETAFAAWQERIPQYEKYRGTLASGPEALAALLEFDVAFDRDAERLASYASLRACEDVAAPKYQEMDARIDAAMDELVARFG